MVLDLLAIWRGEGFADDVSSVSCRRGFENEDLGFFVGRGSVLDAARDDQELARAQLDGSVAEFDAHPPTPDEEHLIRVLVMVPDKRALELDELHFLPVQLCDDPGAPVFGDERKSLGEIDRLHEMRLLHRLFTRFQIIQNGFE